MTGSLPPWNGMEAADAISAIIGMHPHVARLTLYHVSRTAALQDRHTLTPKEQLIVDAGLRLRAQYQLPFWDAMLACCLAQPEPPLHLLESAGFHDESPRVALRVEACRSLGEELRIKAADVGRGLMLVASSALEMQDGSVCHLPMLDFHCRASTENLRLVEAIVPHLRVGGGLILDSGASYHFYGETLFPSDQFARFLGRALLYSPVVDRSWIAHQLLEGSCLLRISVGGKHDVVPRVVSRIEAT